MASFIHSSSMDRCYMGRMHKQLVSETVQIAKTSDPHPKKIEVQTVLQASFHNVLTIEFPKPSNFGNNFIL